MSSDSRTFVIEVEYFGTHRKLYTAETRQDARDFAKVERKKKSVFGVKIRSAKRCPSNVKV